MGMDADSDEEVSGDEYGGSYDEGRDLSDDRAFWRRRVFILCAGVVALRGGGWVVPGRPPPPARPSPRSRSVRRCPPPRTGARGRVPSPAAARRPRPVPPRPPPRPPLRLQHRRSW